jgi:hypothetical protein
MYRLVMDKINSKIKLSLVFSRGGKSAQDPSITTGRSCIFSLETSGTAIYERKCWIFVKTDPMHDASTFYDGVVKGIYSFKLQMSHET